MDCNNHKVFVCHFPEAYKIKSLFGDCPSQHPETPIEKQSRQNPRLNGFHIKQNPLPSQKDKPSNNPGKPDSPL